MRKFLLLAPALLAACAAVPPPPPPTGGECRDNNLAQFVGQPRSAEVEARIRAQSGASIFRWLPRGTIVTMEYSQSRVNAHLDANNRIERVVCG